MSEADTGEKAPAVDGVGENGTTDTGEGAAAESYVGSYKNREEAEKGFAEKEAFAQRMKQERDDALAKNKTDETLAALTRLEAQRSEPQKRSADDYRKEIDEKLESGELTQAQATWEITQQAMFEQDEALKRVQEESEKRISELEQQLSEKWFNNRPEVQARADEIKQIVDEYGMAPEAALRFLTEHKPLAAEHDQGSSTPPGATGSGRVIERDDAPKLTAEEELQYRKSHKGQDVTAEDLVKHADRLAKARRRIRRKRGE